MQRRVLLFLGLVLCVPAMASAAVSVTAASHVFTGAQTALLDITMTATAGEGLNSADIDAITQDLVNNLIAFNPLLLSAADLNGAGTIFGQAASTIAGGAIQDPAENFQSLSVNAAVNVPIGTNGVLIRLQLDSTGVAPGTYKWGLGDTANPNVTIGSTFFSVTGEVVPTYNSGTLQVNAVPEPASVVFGLFAVAGLGAVALRRHRRVA